MSLLEKANRGIGTTAPRPRSSLFSKANAARSPEIVVEPAAEIQAEIAADSPAQHAQPSDSSRFDELRQGFEALPASYDSILRLWTLASSALGLDAIALFLPKDDYLYPVAQQGFPLEKNESAPLSLADPLLRPGQALDPDARALLAPILGVPFSLSLHAAVMWPTSGLVGLWVYHDARLDASQDELSSRLGELLAYGGDKLPASALALPAAKPGAVLLEAARKYPSASVFAFDLSSFSGLARASEGMGSVASFLGGIKAEAVRSSFLGACSRILSQGGFALAYGDNSVACILGSASTVDPDLALFQFTKTLRRILPFLAAASFPEGRALRIDPSSQTALEELKRFLPE